MTFAPKYGPALLSILFLLLVPFFRWPHGFYVMLRFVVSLCAVFYVWTASSLGKTTWTWVMAGVTLLFNPIVPIRMQRSDWRMVDVVVAATFAIWIAVGSRVRAEVEA